MTTPSEPPGFWAPVDESPFAEGTPDDPDRPWRWRDDEEQTEEAHGPEPEDGPIDTDESWQAFGAWALRARCVTLYRYFEEIPAVLRP